MEFWVGDKVIVISLNKTGKVDAYAEDGRLEVDIDGEVYFCSPEDLEEDTTANREKRGIKSYTVEKTVEEEGEEKAPVKVQFESTIDLHIETLNPDYLGKSNGEILNYQKKVVKEFLQQSLENRKGEVLIIHGKGEGVLRREVHEILEAEEDVFHFTVDHYRYNGGATRVILKF